MRILVNNGAGGSGTDGFETAALNILRIVLEGTLPRSKFDSIEFTSVVGDTYLYTFLYESVRQFTVSIADPAGLFTTTITEINNLLDETSSDVILLEDGDEFLLEG